MRIVPSPEQRRKMYMADAPLWADIQGRVWRARGGIRADSGLLVTSDTAYFQFIRYFQYPTVINHVYVLMTTAAAGTVATEIGLFSGTHMPNKAGDTLSKLITTGTLDSLTAAGPLHRGNSTPFAYTVPAKTYLYAGFRAQMGTTQPTLINAIGDRGLGYVLTTAAAGALTGAGPWTGAVPAIAALTTGVGVGFVVTAD